MATQYKSIKQEISEYKETIHDLRKENKQLKSKLEQLNNTFPKYEDMPFDIQNPETYKKVVEFWYTKMIKQ